MSAEYTPERHGGVSVISASRGGLVKTSHHKYEGRRQKSLATAYRTARKVGRSQPVDATPSDRNHFSKGGVYDKGKRDRLSAEQRTDMWRRWKAGESLHEIGRAFGKGHGSIRFLLTQRGGIIVQFFVANGGITLQPACTIHSGFASCDQWAFAPARTALHSPHTTDQRTILTRLPHPRPDSRQLRLSSPISAYPSRLLLVNLTK
jgi:hypothetical protein